jgi:hypothetical protein
LFATKNNSNKQSKFSKTKNTLLPKFKHLVFFYYIFPTGFSAETILFIVGIQNAISISHFFLVLDNFPIISISRSHSPPQTLFFLYISLLHSIERVISLTTGMHPPQAHLHTRHHHSPRPNHLLPPLLLLLPRSPLSLPPCRPVPISPRHHMHIITRISLSPSNRIVRYSQKDCVVNLAVLSTALSFFSYFPFAPQDSTDDRHQNHVQHHGESAASLFFLSVILFVNKNAFERIFFVLTLDYFFCIGLQIDMQTVEVSSSLLSLLLIALPNNRIYQVFFLHSNA